MPEDPARTILITGASGFIGKHLALGLSQKGFRVVAQVRPSSNVYPLSDRQNVQTVYGVMEDPTWLHEVPEKIDIVCHLAICWNDLNAGHDQNFFRALCKRTPFHMIYFSSICAAGLDHAPRPLKESQKPRFCRNDCYGRYKWNVEAMVQTHVDRGDFSATILRPTVVYGPGDRTNVAPLFQAIRRRNLVLWDDGRNTVRLCAVQNLLEVVSAVIGKPGSGIQLYHVGDREQMSLRQFCSSLAAAMGQPLSYRDRPLPWGRSMGFISYVMNRLGWTRSFADHFTYDKWARNLDVDVSRLLKDYPNLEFVGTEEALRSVVKHYFKTGFLEGV